MNKEEVDRTISLLIHQNLCVVNNGNKEYPDFVVGGTDLLKKELSKLFSLYGVSNRTSLTWKIIALFGIGYMLVDLIKYVC